MAALDDYKAALRDPALTRVESATIIVAPQELRDRHAAKDAQLRQALVDSDALARSAEVSALSDELGELEEQLAACTQTYRFKCVGHRAWADLLKKHPPRDIDKRERLGFNMDTFPAAAIAACCIEPEGVDLAFVKELEQSENISETQFAALWGACIVANSGGSGDDVPKSLVAGQIRRASELSEATAVNEESPDLSSSDG